MKIAQWLGFNLLVAGLLLGGCASRGGVKGEYISISEGLPSGQQWKCNPAFGDVNGDGLLDLAAVPRKAEGARVWVYREGQAWSEASQGMPKNISCGGGADFQDIDRDGRLDLAIANHCGGLSVYRGDGEGKWTPSSGGLPPMHADDLALADFNGDGKQDLAACSSEDEGIRVFLGNGKGEWQEARYPDLPTSDDCRELAVGDFNRDGVPDLAATMTERPLVWLSVGREAWKESSSGLPDTTGDGGQYQGIAGGDVNQDGHLDLALGRTTQGPEVYLGDGEGHWRPALSGLSALESAWGVGFGDMDKDGHVDLVVSGAKDYDEEGNIYGIFLFLGDGKGNWKLQPESGLPERGLTQSWGVTLADIDGDDMPEIGGCFGQEAQPLFNVQGGGGPEVWKFKKPGQ
jgi:hypothetical protein